MPANAGGQHAEPGKTKPVVAVQTGTDAVPPQLGELLPQRSRIAVSVKERTGQRQGGSRVEQIVCDRTQRHLVVGEFEVHAQLRGRPSIRWAMMFFWICSLPPYTEAARL